MKKHKSVLCKLCVPFMLLRKHVAPKFSVGKLR